jgi:hypothetical protein
VRLGKALALVVESQEALAGEVEAVLGPQLAVDDVHEDLLLEIEQLEDGEGVALAAALTARCVASIMKPPV